MNTGSQILVVLSLVSAAAVVHVVARSRPGRFLLMRVPDGERHRAATRRVIVVTTLVTLAGIAMVVGSSDGTGRTQLIGGFAGFFVPPLWILGELWFALRGTPLSAVSSRYHVSLQRPPGLVSYLSLPLQIVNAVAMIAPPVLLLLVWRTFGPWFLFFLPMMLFLTALVLFCAWMQARERWVLPAEEAERYVQLQHEKRTRTVRLLEIALASWNLAAALMWISAAAGTEGPGYLGAAAGVVLGGPGVVIALFVQLPRLTEIADELTALAGTEALGTRSNGWRWGGLVYCAPSDPALFVAKRSGLGQTLNLARPAAWFFLAGVLLVPLAITLLALAGARS